MKRYIKPAISVVSLDLENIIMTSNTVIRIDNETTVDPGNARIRERHMSIFNESGYWDEMKDN